MVGGPAQQVNPDQGGPAGMAVAGLAKLVVDVVAPLAGEEDHPTGELQLKVLQGPRRVAALYFQETGSGDLSRRERIEGPERRGQIDAGGGRVRAGPFAPPVVIARHVRPNRAVRTTA